MGDEGSSTLVLGLKAVLVACGEEAQGSWPTGCSGSSLLIAE